jgi:hypothetical protein
MHGTLSEPIQATMLALTERVRDALGNRVIGVYLGGSASMGDFSESASDLDFLVVTDGALTSHELDMLSEMHDRLRCDTPLGDRLEGDYAPRELLVPEGTLAPVPECRDGRLHRDVQEIMLSADNLYNMQEHGIRFFGPEPRDVLPQVTPDDVRAAVREMLDEGPEPGEMPAQAASDVLDLVRSLCALEAGLPCTKVAGARWALDHLDARWHPVVRAALAVRDAQATSADDTLVCQQLGLMYAALWPPGTPESSEATSQE